MNPFRTSARRADPLWDVASETQIFTADEQTLTALTRDVGIPDGQWIDGVLLAQRHPTGWFVHAVRRDTLAADQVPLLDEAVTVRSYLLFTEGSETPTWLPVSGGQEWLSLVYSVGEELDLVDGALVR